MANAILFRRSHALFAHAAAGVVVGDVGATGAGARAGLRRGDLVTAVNDVGIEHVPLETARAALVKAGRKVVLCYC